MPPHETHRAHLFARSFGKEYQACTSDRAYVLLTDPQIQSAAFKAKLISQFPPTHRD
jgi:hypothetical protein